MPKSNVVQLPTSKRKDSTLLRVEQWGEFDIPIYQMKVEGVLLEVPQHIVRMTQSKYDSVVDGWFIRFERQTPGPYRHFVGDYLYDGSSVRSLEAAKTLLWEFLSTAPNVQVNLPRRTQEHPVKYLKTGVSGLCLSWRLRRLVVRGEEESGSNQSPCISLCALYSQSRRGVELGFGNISRNLILGDITLDTVRSVVTDVYGEMLRIAACIDRKHHSDSLARLEAQTPKPPTQKELVDTLESFLDRNDQKHLTMLTPQGDLSTIKEGSRLGVGGTPLWWTTRYLDGVGYRVPYAITPYPDIGWVIDERLTAGSRYVDTVPFDDDPDQSLKVAVGYLYSALIRDSVSVLKQNTQ